jgi:chemosensory pili system protein ChpE
MDDPGALFLYAFGLGLAFCAPPGVITTEAMRRGLSGGFWRALFLELGSLVGDATWAIVALTGAVFLVQNDSVRIGLSVAGVLFLAHLAWAAAHDAYAGGLPKLSPAAPRGDFAAGAALSLSNPMNIAFWLGVGGGVLSADASPPQPIDVAIFFGGFMLAAVAWCFFISGLIAWGRRFLTPGCFRAVNLLCALALTYFALDLARGTLGS